MQFSTKFIVKNIFTCIAMSLLSACGGGGSSSTASPPPTLSAAIDGVMKNFMTTYGPSAATVAVVKNGVVLYNQGYGYQDAAKTIPLPASALFVTASIVKPVTAAAIQKLAAAGTLALSDHVFCTGTNLPCWLPSNLLSATSDPRAKDITIGQLIAHQGGWDRNETGQDLVGEESLVQSFFGLSTPPQRSDDIRYQMTKPLDFTPGTRTAYSNVGYLLLGMIVEQATNTPYTQYVNTNIFTPLGIASADFQAATSLIKDRGPREPDYITALTGPSVFVPGTTVLADDGVANAPNWVSVGSSITTSKAMAIFAGNYRIDATTAAGVDGPLDGIPLAGKTNDGYHNGSWPFSMSILRQLPSGVSYAVLTNNGNTAFTALQVQMDAAIATVNP